MLSKRTARHAFLFCGSIVVTGFLPVNPAIAHRTRLLAPWTEGSLAADGSPMPIPKPAPPGRGAVPSRPVIASPAMARFLADA